MGLGGITFWVGYRIIVWCVCVEEIDEKKKAWSGGAWEEEKLIVFGQTILVIPFYILEWSKWFENSLKMIWNGLKKNNVELFDFVNFEVV